MTINEDKLKQVCELNHINPEIIRKLMSIEKKFQLKEKRRGIIDEIKNIVENEN
jgi:hypothetical protein